MPNKLSVTDYIKFANAIRYTTAKALLDTIESSSSAKLFNKSKYYSAIVSDIDVKKILSLKIVDEFIASTEDFSMWFMALKNWKTLFKHGESIELEFETYLLQNGVTKKSRNETKQTIDEIAKLNSIEELATALNLPPIIELVAITKVKDGTIEKELSRILKGVKLIHTVRNKYADIFLTLHNRMKHGLVINKDGEFKKIDYISSESIDTKILQFDLNINFENINSYVKRIHFMSHTILSVGGLITFLYLYQVRLRRLKKLN